MSAFQPGDLIGGRYRLMRIIGSGAMGTVWSARNESTDRDFALKLMLPDAAKNPIALQRFFQEAKASGRLRHRSIVEVYDLGRIEPRLNITNDPRAGTPYLVMELLEGEPLDSVLRRRKTLPIGTALRIVRDLARALDVAHKQRIVHRDLKPANVYLHKTLEGTIVPKILDFGISKLVGPTNFDAVATSVGTVLGSPAYMSPEQAAGEIDVDGRSDVWSLGVILYKSLCGAVPFSAPNYNALMMAITRNAHPPLCERVVGLPSEVDALIDKCLAKAREDRLESAKLLADEIDRILVANPALPFEELQDIVVAPVELPADDAHTIATTAMERSQGTLAATELAEQPAPVASVPSSRTPTPTRALPSEPPPFRPSLSKRVRVMASAVGVALLLGIVVFVSTRRDSPAAPPPTPAAPFEKPKPIETTAVPPPAITSAAPTVATTTAPSTPAPTPPTTTAAAPATNTAPASNTAVAVKPTVQKPQPTAKPTTKPGTASKPVHEGVTGAGF